MLRLTTLAIVLALAGCVSYRPRPLPPAPRWAPAPTDAAGHVLQRLDLTEAAALALRANPGYRAALIEARISTLQLRAAGLLPDPQLGVGVDHPSTPGYSQAWNLGLSEDLSALLTRGARLDAARAQRTATRLQLAWQGWALAQGAAATYVDLWTAERRSALLTRQVQMARERDAAFAHALGNGDVTL
ncbi:MAG: TolC family protein, partial [Xanthomonadaceae bacterium]|nr:TolC family protein [Xanthomonadaceae bacterium]